MWKPQAVLLLLSSVSPLAPITQSWIRKDNEGKWWLCDQQSSRKPDRLCPKYRLSGHHDSQANSRYPLIGIRQEACPTLLPQPNLLFSPHLSILLEVELLYDPVSPYVSWMVRRSVGLSVSHSFLKGREVSIPCSFGALLRFLSADLTVLFDYEDNIIQTQQKRVW